MMIQGRDEMPHEISLINVLMASLMPLGTSRNVTSYGLDDAVMIQPKFKLCGDKVVAFLGFEYTYMKKYIGWTSNE